MIVKTLTSAILPHQKLSKLGVLVKMLYHHKEYTKQLTSCMPLTWRRVCVRVMKVVRESHLFVDHLKELNPLDNHQKDQQLTLS